MGRKPDYPKQIQKLNQEIKRLKACIARDQKLMDSEKKRLYSAIEKEKAAAYKAGCQDALRAIEDEETAYMTFMKQAQLQFEKMYRKKISKKKQKTT